MNELKEGLELKAATLPDTSYYVVGSNAVSITVRMQTGQMAMIPWLEIELADGRKLLFNCTYIADVQFIPKPKTEAAG